MSDFCVLLTIYKLYSENNKKCLGMLRKKKYRCGNAKSLFLFSRPAFFHSLLQKACTFISDIDKLSLSNSRQVIQNGKNWILIWIFLRWEWKRDKRDFCSRPSHIQIKLSILVHFTAKLDNYWNFNFCWVFAKTAYTEDFNSFL